MKENKKPEVKAMTCEQAIKLVFRYIDDELGGKQRGELDQHLKTCRHCFDRVEFETRLKSRLRSLKVGTVSDDLRRRINSLLEQF